MQEIFLNRQGDNFNMCEYWIESSLQWNRRQYGKTIELWKEQFFLIYIIGPSPEVCNILTVSLIHAYVLYIAYSDFERIESI